MTSTRTPDAVALRRVIRRLRDGQPVALPDVTVDTLYGDGTEGVFRVRSAAGDHALKLSALDAEGRYWLGREADAARWAAAQDLGPEVILALPERGALVTAYLPGASLEPSSAREPSTLRRIAALFRAVHAGPPMAHTATLRADIDAALGFVTAALPPDLGDLLARRLPRVWEVLDRAPVRSVPCHNDPHPGNVFPRGDGLVFIDWAAGAMGDPGWDLAVLASSAELVPAQRTALWTAYDPAGTTLDPARQGLWDLLADTYHLAWYLQASTDESHTARRFAARVRAGSSALGVEA